MANANHISDKSERRTLGLQESADTGDIDRSNEHRKFKLTTSDKLHRDVSIKVNKILDF